MGLKLTMRIVRFSNSSWTRSSPAVTCRSLPARGPRRRGGFRLTPRPRLRLHYAKTLDIWAEALETRKDEAIAIQSQEVYDRYMKYLTGCADLFREGYTDICQFTLAKS